MDFTTYFVLTQLDTSQQVAFVLAQLVLIIGCMAYLKWGLK